MLLKQETLDKLLHCTRNQLLGHTTQASEHGQQFTTGEKINQAIDLRTIADALPHLQDTDTVSKSKKFQNPANSIGFRVATEPPRNHCHMQPGHLDDDDSR